jgi:hypothetical protein
MADDRLARTFVELADTLVDDFDMVEFLHKLVDRCMELLDVSATGLLLGDSCDQLRVMASSAENIHLLELFQLQNHDGPCLDCYRTGAPVSHPDLSMATDRWPLFGPGTRPTPARHPRRPATDRAEQPHSHRASQRRPRRTPRHRPRTGLHPAPQLRPQPQPAAHRTSHRRHRRHHHHHRNPPRRTGRRPRPVTLTRGLSRTSQITADRVY